MSIDLDSFPLPNYEKEREAKSKPRTETEVFLLPSLSEIKLAKATWAGRPGLSLLLCFRHEKEARKKYAQRAEDPLRVSVVSVGNCTIFSPIVLNQ